MTKLLILNAISFPNFKGDDSKKNFRMIYYVTCDVDKVDKDENPIKNPDGTTKQQPVTIIIEKPKSKDCWQWEKEYKNLYLPPINKAADPVSLDLSRLKTNDFGFQSDNFRIGDYTGTLKGVRVEIYDVHDPNFGEKLKQVLGVVGKDIIKLVAGSLIGLPASVADIIASGVMVYFGDSKKAADAVATEGQQVKSKDKLLFGGYADFLNGEESITIDGERYWDGNKKGKYSITLGLE